MVYVDELRSWPQAPEPGAERWFGNGKPSAHMHADTHDELHAFAELLGLKRTWFQPKHGGHYDLTPAKRARALKFGAVFVPQKDQILRRRSQETQQTLFD